MAMGPSFLGRIYRNSSNVFYIKLIRKQGKKIPFVYVGIYPTLFLFILIPVQQSYLSQARIECINVTSLPLLMTWWTKRTD